MLWINRLWIVVRLLVLGERRFVRWALYAIPIIFSVIFYSFLTGNRLISNFEQSMQQSYVGVLGRLSISSPSAQLIDSLYSEFHQAGLPVSRKLTQKALLYLQTADFQGVRGVDLYVYQPGYLAQKFTQQTSNEPLIVLSSVLARQLNISAQQSLRLANPQHKGAEIDFPQVIISDLGFLTSAPVLMIDARVYEILFLEMPRFTTLEFAHLPRLGLFSVQQQLKSFLQNQPQATYTLQDVAQLTREHQRVFRLISGLTWVVAIILVLLNILLSAMALNMAIKAKRNGILTLQLLGMTPLQLWLCVLVVWFSVLTGCYVLAHSLFLWSAPLISNYLF